MSALGDGFRCVAPDLRGYDLSDKPKGHGHYVMPRLVEDVVAVVQAPSPRSDNRGALAALSAVRRRHPVTQYPPLPM